jgi:signal transduction histidine kinase
MRSIRFRLTVLYSGLLFLLATLLIGALYVGLSVSLRDEPISREDTSAAIEQSGGDIRAAAAALERRRFEQRVNENTLENLRNFSFGALGGLFLASLGVGWLISGRVLAPVDRITVVGRDIQATNLGRRIELDGPDDELKRLADTFDDMLDRLERAFSAQRRLVADASHELRNPLAIVQTNLDVALAASESDPERLRHAALVARRATDRMARLVDDLLALARLESPALRRNPVDLWELARESGEEFAASAEGRGVVLETTGGSGIAVLGDRDTLKRAVGNLLENAIRHSPVGGRVQIAAAGDNGWVALSVEDEGPGIPREHQTRVFDRFYRVDKARSRSAGGSGLGLAIVRQIAEAHGGTVELVSEPGRGSAFTLRLPRATTS